jgi:hypothetical protein
VNSLLTLTFFWYRTQLPVSFEKLKTPPDIHQVHRRRQRAVFPNLSQQEHEYTASHHPCAFFLLIGALSLIQPRGFTRSLGEDWRNPKGKQVCIAINA